MKSLIKFYFLNSRGRASFLGRVLGFYLNPSAPPPFFFSSLQRRHTAGEWAWCLAWTIVGMSAVSVGRISGTPRCDSDGGLGVFLVSSAGG